MKSPLYPLGNRPEAKNRSYGNVLTYWIQIGYPQIVPMGNGEKILIRLSTGLCMFKNIVRHIIRTQQRLKHKTSYQGDKFLP